MARDGLIIPLPARVEPAAGEVKPLLWPPTSGEGGAATAMVRELVVLLGGGSC